MNLNAPGRQINKSGSLPVLFLLDCAKQKWRFIDTRAFTKMSNQQVQELLKFVNRNTNPDRAAQVAIQLAWAVLHYQDGNSADLPRLNIHPTPTENFSIPFGNHPVRELRTI